MTFVAPNSFTVSDKRQRVVTVARASRPIDKTITTIQQFLNATQDQTVITNPTFPSTMTGLRWNLTFSQSAGTSLAQYQWAIVFLAQDETIDTLAFGDNLRFYTPEKNCLVWGYGTIFNMTQTNHVDGSTKTMRKLMVGDRIIFIALGIATNTVQVDGAVQLFLKA